jgi:protein gp37
MSQNSKIEWTHASWNPVTGCTKISVGCQNCYAERMAKRLKGRFGYPQDEPFRITLHKDKFTEPSHWKQPRMIFVCSMGDLFHADVEFEIINDIFNIMMWNDRHIYQILTKRPANLINWFKCSGFSSIPDHIWVGITAENQLLAEQRIKILASLPAKIKFISFEPLLGEIDLKPFNDFIDWIIVGGETGPGARLMHYNWAIELQEDANKFKIPFYFKKWGDYYKRFGRNSSIVSPDMKREFPNGGLF